MVSQDGKVGVDKWNSAIKGFDFKPNVYDARKMTPKNNYARVLATVKDDNNKPALLNTTNAGVFITYKSVAGGTIEFSDIVASKVGLSLSNKFTDLYIKRNKSDSTESAFNNNDFVTMCGDDEESEDDVVMPSKNSEAKSLDKSSKKVVLAAEASDIEDHLSDSDLDN